MFLRETVPYTYERGRSSNKQKKDVRLKIDKTAFSISTTHIFKSFPTACIEMLDICSIFNILTSGKGSKIINSTVFNCF